MEESLLDVKRMHSDAQGKTIWYAPLHRGISISQNLFSPRIFCPRVIKCARAWHDASAQARRRKLSGRAAAHKSMTQVTGIGDLARRADLPSFTGRRDLRRDALAVKHLSYEKSAPRELRFQFYVAQFRACTQQRSRIKLES